VAGLRFFKKISIFHYAIIAIAVLIFSLCVFLSIEKFNQIDSLKSRQYFSLIQSELSQDKEPKVKGVNYAVISLSGTVQKSAIPKYKEHETVDLKTLAGIDGIKERNRVYFAAPLIKDNVQTGTLILLIDLNLLRNESSAVIWIILSGLLCISIILLVLQTKSIMKKDISKPLDTLNRIAKKMAGGDYSEKLLYDYTDEIGLLCHNIEILRDDLKASQDREDKLKNNEKFLLACISHDLKTPLAIISGTAESLKDDMVASNIAADRILNKTAALNKLINDILEQTKTELNEFSVNLSECYAKSFFEKELGDFQTEAEKNGLKYIVSDCPDCIINIDKQRIVQVLHNLIGNAMKYTPKGGTIAVNFQVKDNLLIISVKDTGLGISAADLPFIFDKFYRGEKARSVIAGSGLGLPISKYIIEKHGGKIECDTVLSKGTEMSFSLPL